MKTTPWTRQERDEFIEWHESVISRYPNEDLRIGDKIFNVYKELRSDRDKFLFGVRISN